MSQYLLVYVCVFLNSQYNPSVFSKLQAFLYTAVLTLDTQVFHVDAHFHDDRPVIVRKHDAVGHISNMYNECFLCDC